MGKQRKNFQKEERKNYGGKSANRIPRNGRDAKESPTMGRCDVTKLRSNDVSYYNKFPDVTTAANWYWSQVMGNPIDMDGLTGTVQSVKLGIPSMMGFNISYGPGYAGEQSDGINRSFAQIMSELYAKTSAGELPFTQASLAMMMTSLNSIAVNLSLIRRNLQTVPFWISRNRLYPKLLLEAYGTNFEDEVSGMAANIVKFNSLIRMFNNMQIPAFLDVYKRQISMFQNVWVDEDSPMGQIYFCRPNGYYKYCDTANKAEWVEISQIEGAYTTQSLLNTVEEQINAWYNSQDLYLIRGSLTRAFGEFETLSIPEFNSSETLTPVTDKVMMQQFTNCTICPGLYNLDITENVTDNTIIWRPKLSYAEEDINHINPQIEALFNRNKIMLRDYSDSPTIEDNIEMTRLTQSVTIEGSEIIVHAQPEIVTSYDIYQTDVNRDGDVSIQSTRYYWNFRVFAHDETSASFAVLLSSFRYCPLLFNIYLNEMGLLIAWDIAGDVYNYTYVSPKQLENLNWLALQSLYKPNLTVKR